MPRRTSVEIERDVKKIQNAINDQNVKSLSDLAEKVDLSVEQIRCSFSRHPIMFKRLKVQIEKNRETDQEIGRVKEDKKRVQETACKVKEKVIHYYVIDTSIASEVAMWNKLFDDIIASGNKIVVTSIVREELFNLQHPKYESVDSYGARHLLKRIASDEVNFVSVKIPNDEKTNDLSIIRYCTTLRNVTLVTCDKEMALAAREENIDTKFCVKTSRYIPNEEANDKKVPDIVLLKPEERECNIPGAMMYYGSLIIPAEEFKTAERTLKVVSPYSEKTTGPLELFKGDNVYVITKMAYKDFIRVEQFRVEKVAEKDNAKVIYRREIHVKREFDRLPTRMKRFVASYLRTV